MKAASTARSRLSALALALLLGAAGLAWLIGGEPDVPDPAGVAPSASAPQLTGADAGFAQLATDPELSTRSGLDRAPEPTRASALAQLDVRVLGGRGERAKVETWFRRESETEFAHALHETEVDGRLELAFPAGSLRLTAWTSSRVSVQHEVELRTRALVLELTLLAPAAVRGRVTRAGSGEPITGAALRVPNWSAARTSFSDSSGHYELALPTEGEHDYEIHCAAEGFAREISIVHVRPGESWKATVNLPDSYPKELHFASTAARIDFVLLPQRTVTGFVYAGSTPLAGATVRAAGLLRIDPNSVPDDAITQTDGRGSFTLSGLRPDVGHLLAVWHPTYADRWLQVPPALEALRDIGTIELQRPHRLEVLARDAEGVLAEDIGITLDLPAPMVPGTGHPGLGIFKRDGSPFHTETVVRQEQTGADGTARFTALPAVDCSVRAIDGDNFIALCEPITVRVGTAARLELKLSYANPIYGHVVAAGKPVERARVTLIAYTHRKTHTKPDGSFSFTGNRVGPAYCLRAEWVDENGVEWSGEGDAHRWDVPNVIVLQPPP